MFGDSQFKTVFRRIVYAGLSENTDIEILRKVFLINVFSTIGMAFFVGFGVNAIVDHRDQTATVLLVLASLTLINYVLMLRFGKHDRGAHVISLIMCFLFFYLICTGGVHLTGPLWCYAAAPFGLFIYGVRWGAVSVVFLFFSAAILLYLPNPLVIVHYPSIFKSRFLASFLAVAIMAYMHEYARHRSYCALVALRREVEQEARTDELTELFNRRHMYEYLQLALHRMRRVKTPMCVLLIDIDNFKLINDNYGHQFGDQVLIEIAQTLQNSLRDNDSIARWGGEEFLVVLTDTDRDAAKIVAEKLRYTIENLSIRYDGTALSVTISIGMHTAAINDSLENMLKCADENLYAAKNGGRNLIVESGPESAETLGAKERLGVI